jgi:hypothetical protein
MSCSILIDDHGQALHTAPHDKAVLYNIAMMMQKAAEMMFATPLAKRQIADLESAIDQGAKAQRYVTPKLPNCQESTIEEQALHFSGRRRVSFPSIRQEHRGSEAEIWR